MAAGLGFKTFNTGDVLTAADTNGYLMQGVWVFANSTARTSAVTSPQEGNVSFLKDTNSLEIYDGASWVAYGAGDITEVTAGTGISGGGTSGTVTVTNSMATEITAAGDIIVGTGSGTFDNLPIGTTGQVLTADTTVSPYKVKWAAAASGGGGKLGQLVQTVTTTTTTSNSTTFADCTNFSVSITPSASTSKVLVIVDVSAEASYPSGGGTGSMGLRILRGSTAIYTKGTALSHDHSGSSGAQNIISQQQLIYLDSPATTSSTTYKLQLNAGSSTHTGRVNNANQDSSITVLEILA